MSEQIVAGKLPAIIASRYVPIREIGRGGMGIVYEVEHIRTGERLALKVLLSTVGSSPDALERFKREARASARIKSENVVRVTDADIAVELDGAPFLVMELLEGSDIERAANDARPTPATVVEWLRQVARVIDKAHRLGIVHRDLKPENLFLSAVEERAPVVKVLDFGIAKMAQDGATGTGSGQVLGTPKYMAPEQAAGNPTVSSATDLYALGLVAYRLIMGESYYQDDNVMSILGQLLHGSLQPPSARDPKFGVAFDDWFKKACHRNPEDRFASAALQIEALADALGVPTVPIEMGHERSGQGGALPVAATPPRGSTSPGPSSSPAPAVTAKVRRSIAGLSGLALVAAAIAAASWFMSRDSKTAHPTADRVTATSSAPATAPTAIPKTAAVPVPVPVPVAAPTTVPVATRLAAPDPGKKSRTLVRPTHSGFGARPRSSTTDDPFRDQK